MRRAVPLLPVALVSTARATTYYDGVQFKDAGD